MARITLAAFLVAASLTGCGGGSTAQTDGRARLSCPPCPSGQVCVDDPRDACNPVVAECRAICVTAVSCGGIAAIPCPAGQTCVDDPRDDCVSPPGADCGGLCAPAR
jgi:hypothetical protein